MPASKADFNPEEICSMLHIMDEWEKKSLFLSKMCLRKSKQRS